ncbi:hypothetical protein EVAR_81411_1 [Eumeta japonica]|uniref:Uncharacterized protein n=1 Tax=Eumeta variegata TaxID=151549 RepID=A0A4C1WF77_EUMVA|nr:hypothetical protein EVAR_81411_1 [Eumeta japonica]
MYSKELASARQVEPVNQALGTVIFSGVYHKGACPLPCKDVNSLTGIDSGSRRSPTGCKLTHRNRFWLEEEPYRMEYFGCAPAPSVLADSYQMRLAVFAVGIIAFAEAAAT